VSNSNEVADGVVDADEEYARLSEVFESSAKRWELIVYPSLFAFIILAAYGFYLIYNLAKDVHYLAISVDTNMTTLAGNMQNVSENMGQLTTNIRAMTVTMLLCGTLLPAMAILNRSFLYCSTSFMLCPLK